MVEWLEPDKTHPPRPDTPILRHFTFTEAHAVELGVYLGLFVVWALSMNQNGAAFSITVGAFRKVMSRQRSVGGGTPCDHDIGFHDAVEEPHYFGFPAVLIVGAYYVFLLF